MVMEGQMVCEKKACSEKFELAKTDMVVAGFDPSQIADFVSQFGEDVINLVVEALKGGFSKQFVVDVLTKFGPVVLKFLLDWFNSAQSNSAAKGVSGLDQATLDISLVETFLQNMLPKLLSKYGEQLLDLFVGLVVKYLTK